MNTLDTMIAGICHLRTGGQTTNQVNNLLKHVDLSFRIRTTTLLDHAHQVRGGLEQGYRGTNVT